MSLHRLICAFGSHYFVLLGSNWRGCCVCHQQQRYVEDAMGLHGFWMNVHPRGGVAESVNPSEESK